MALFMGEPYGEQLRKIIMSREVLKKLDEVGQALAERAKQFVDAADQDEVVTYEGVRPGTQSPTGLSRPYARVAVKKDWEYGSPQQERMRVLGRALVELLK